MMGLHEMLGPGKIKVTFKMVVAGKTTRPGKLTLPGKEPMYSVMPRSF
jgi:hypothetical protein